MSLSLRIRTTKTAVVAETVIDKWLAAVRKEANHEPEAVAAALDWATEYPDCVTMQKMWVAYNNALWGSKELS